MFRHTLSSQNIKYALCKTVETFNGKRKLTINGSNWRIFEKKVPPQIPNLRLHPYTYYGNYHDRIYSI